MLPHPLPILEDKLVRLRPLVGADREVLYSIARDELLWAQHQFKDRYQRPVFERLFDEGLAGKGAFTVMDQQAAGRVIGSTRLKYLDHTALEIGWTFLDRRMWGTAYNRAMKDLLITYVFGLGMDVIFYVDKFNIRSRKAVGKLGAELLTDTGHPLYTQVKNGLTYLLRRTHH